jgi:hypothetical protein
VTYNKCCDDIGVAQQEHDTRVASLQEAVDSFTTWRSEVEPSPTSFQLELTNLNTFFDREAKVVTTTKSVILPIGSASAPPLSCARTDDPHGHRVDNFYQDCEFGQVFTQIHDPVKGTITDPHPPPQSTANSALDSPQFHTDPNPSARSPIGRLPKLDFPRFDGDNPKLWQSRCKNYFDMYSVEPSIWIKVATMNFEGAATCWLQSVDRKVRSTSWSEVCS